MSLGYPEMRLAWKASFDVSSYFSQDCIAPIIIWVAFDVGILLIFADSILESKEYNNLFVRILKIFFQIENHDLNLNLVLPFWSWFIKSRAFAFVCTYPGCSDR